MGPIVVDVKPKDRLKDAVVADTLAWTRLAIEQQGWAYEVSSELPAVEMGNIRFLSGFRQFNPQLPLMKRYRAKARQGAQT